jgi:hypothetical protein
MALPILDGNQTAVTLATTVSGGQHFPNHIIASGTVSVRTDLDVNSSQPCVAVAFDSTAGVQRVGNTNGFPIRPMQDGSGNSIPLAISGTVTIGSALPAGTNRIGVVTIGGGTVTIGAGTAQIGSVTVGNSVTIGSLPAIFADPSGFTTVVAGISDVEVNTIRSVLWIPQENGSDGEMLSQANPLPISGTVTANSSNGELTTRFGSITTANTAFSTTAVTNTSRKYLMIQNIASTVITAGIGFTPTTTQGIQIVAGATITFDGNYIPTGAVRILSSVTASNFTVLEA